MEEKRAKTLEALEKFIQSQKALLERTHADIARLGELRKDVENDPPHDWESLGSKLNDPAFRLSEQLDAMPALPENLDLDWSVFAGADPAPFRTLAANAREAYAAKNAPPQKPLTAPSALRQFVAARRVAIIDPVLSTFRLPDDLAMLSSDDEPDPEELRRARERDKIRDLKKRRIEGDAGTPLFAGLGLCRPVSGVFIRRDQEDESAEVDISMGDEARATSALGSASEVPMAVDTPPATSVTSPASASLPAQASTRRESRPTRKGQADAKKTKAPPKAKPQPKPKQKVEPDKEETPAAGPARDKNGKVKSETYKQAWSVSEQHLLERLLEEIPDGEKNRWAKISKAMNGRRTARQVASRVQKYYEKLKRYGVEVGSSKGAAG